MKADLLFIMNNLDFGGAEKSLLALLKSVDYTRFNVDLFLFKHEGRLLDQLPKQVRLLPEPALYKYFDMPLPEAVGQSLKEGRLGVAALRAAAGYWFRTEKNGARCEQRVWRYVSRAIAPLGKRYDAAVGYLEKSPIYFCVDKVKAATKIGFIHTDYERMGMHPAYDQPYFARLDKIVAVSEPCADILKRIFPDQASKVTVLHNIVSPPAISAMSDAFVPYRKRDAYYVVSVGRLHPLKGYDMAIEACRLLLDQGYKVRWQVIGEGEDRSRLERMIADRGLQESFQLLGAMDNPYPYMKHADLYVHPSRYEGKSIAIDEAKILGKPIVVTDFPTAKDHITDGCNGVIAEMNPDSLAACIGSLLTDDAQRAALAANLKQSEWGTETEIHKFYELVNQG